MIFCYSIGTAAFFSFILILLFVTKKKIINEQTKIFTHMLFSNLFGLLLELATMIYLIHIPNYNILLANLLVKLYLLYTAYFVSQMTCYIFSVAYEKNDNDYYEKIKLYSNVALIIVLLTGIFLPVHINGYFRYGTLLLYILTYSLFNIFFWIIVLIRNYNKFNAKTLTPILIIVAIGLSAALFQVFNPTIAILTIIEFELMVLSFLTMENTDYKMITNLTAAKNEVLEAYKNKNEFLKNMSHEIRTPLNGLIGLSEDIKCYEGEIPEGLLAEAEELTYNSSLLLETVSSIIDINKLASHNFEKIEKTYNIQNVMDSISKALFNKTKANVKLSIKVDPDIPALYGDADHIRQIISKIINNAVLSTSSGNIDIAIDLPIKHDVPTLRFLINDTGIGIHEEVLPYIYNYNDEKIKKNKYYDAKIFLNFTVAKKLLDAIKGTISLSSTYNQGTTVVIEIPQVIKKEEK